MEQSTLFENELPSAIVLLDRDFCILNHNKSWLQYSESERLTLTGQPLFDILPAAKHALTPLLESAFSGELATQKRISFTLHNSRVYWDVTLVPQIDEDGQVDKVLLEAYAMTEETLLRQVLQQRVDDRTRKLEALYAIAAVATETQDMAEALNECLVRILSATTAHAGAIHLLERDDRSNLRLVAHMGLTAPLINQLEQIAREVGSREWTILHDANLVPADPESISTREMTYLAVPLYPNGEMSGLLCLFRQTRRPFSSIDTDLLDSVADQVGSIIHKFRLQEENADLLLQEERSRLAHQLHDAVTQSLYSLTLFAGALQEHATRAEWQKCLPYVDRIQGTGQQALKEMRLLLHNLRPIPLETDGLIEALRQRLNAVERRANVSGQLISKLQLTMPPDLEAQLYFIANEALNNALKHANAGQVRVFFAAKGAEILMKIEDDGDGFDVDAGLKSGGLGLVGMAERARQLGGRLMIESQPGEGTTITVTTPYLER